MCGFPSLLQWLFQFIVKHKTLILIFILSNISISRIIKYPLVYEHRHLSMRGIDKYLMREVNPRMKWVGKPLCRYDLNTSIVYDQMDIKAMVAQFDSTGLDDGSYFPWDCTPQFSVAILVTFRDRQKQLDTFLRYMHTFLRLQKIHYKIFVIEQYDSKLWNKGLLYNIGAHVAMEQQFPCLILHDVDLLPLSQDNLYACLHSPRHMASAVDKLRFVLMYTDLIGGVSAITAAQYRLVNGHSNRYLGWGGEDDNFAERILLRNLEILRFPIEMSLYTMQPHPEQELVNPGRFHEVRTHSEMLTDGLNSVGNASYTYHDQPLYGLIRVST